MFKDTSEIWSGAERSASGCLIWNRATNGRGYGQIQIRGRLMPAHRAAYELVNGPIPDGLVIDHLCRTTLCIEPSHLEAVTPRENTLRGDGPSARAAKQTHCRHGHEFSLENTYLDPKRGKRVCRRCRANRMRAAKRSRM